MPLPREAVYNDLNGLEVSEILKARMSALLATVPYLQKHLTLPRVRMSVRIELVVRADQEGADRHTITDDFVVRTEDAAAGDLSSDRRVAGYDVVDASPGPADSGHKTPGEIRDDHGLPDAVPTKGPIATEDQFLRAGDVPMPPDKNFGRLPTEQEKLAAHRAQQEEKRIALEPPAAPVTIPGVMIERGTRRDDEDKTFVTMNRGGPAIGGVRNKPILEPQLRNSGAAPDKDLFRGTDFRESKRRDV